MSLPDKHGIKVYCNPISTRTSPRKRSASPCNIAQASSPPKRRTTRQRVCPHTMSMLRSTRLFAEDQCPICREDFFHTLTGHEQVIPVKMGCGHIFRRSCIETHRSSEIKCPMPWCQENICLQPDWCELCAYWVRQRTDSLILTVRAEETAASIDDALQQLAQENEFFQLSKETKRKLLAYVRRTLQRFEWRYYAGVDIAELLDPFLHVVDPEYARAYFGPKLCAPVRNPCFFPLRTNDPDDYSPG